MRSKSLSKSHEKLVRELCFFFTSKKLIQLHQKKNVFPLYKYHHQLRITYPHCAWPAWTIAFQVGMNDKNLWRSAIRNVIHMQPVRSLRGIGWSSSSRGTSVVLVLYVASISLVSILSAIPAATTNIVSVAAGSPKKPCPCRKMMQA